MAETIKKGARVVGPHRDRLAAELAKEYAQGVSIRDLAAKTGRSYGFVHRILSESGTQLRGRGGATRGSGGQATRQGRGQQASTASASSTKKSGATKSARSRKKA